MTEVHEWATALKEANLVRATGLPAYTALLDRSGLSGIAECYVCKWFPRFMQASFAAAEVAVMPRRQRYEVVAAVSDMLTILTMHRSWELTYAFAVARWIANATDEPTILTVDAVLDSSSVGDATGVLDAHHLSLGPTGYYHAAGVAALVYSLSSARQTAGWQATAHAIARGVITPLADSRESLAFRPPPHYYMAYRQVLYEHHPRQWLKMLLTAAAAGKALSRTPRQAITGPLHDALGELWAALLNGDAVEAVAGAALSTRPEVQRHVPTMVHTLTRAVRAGTVRVSGALPARLRAAHPAVAALHLPWSPALQQLFPPCVRVAAKALLLIRGRLDGPLALPPELWRLIMSRALTRDGWD